MSELSHEQAYQYAQDKIQEALLSEITELKLTDFGLSELPDSLGQLTKLISLDLSNNQIMQLPVSLGNLTELRSINLSRNQLTSLPDSFGQLSQLRALDISHNQLRDLPDSLGNLLDLDSLYLNGNQIEILPQWIGNMTMLSYLWLGYGRKGNPLKEIPDLFINLQNLRQLLLQSCQVTELPPFLAQIKNLRELLLTHNPLNPELAAAYQQGIEAVKLYLRAGAVAPVYESKLIIVGEGEVGKTCLMDALLDKPFQSHESTHGIQIESFKIIAPNTQKEITLNVWDFGGQPIYRSTHQLFFSAPAVYLVVWKPREGPQQGFVKEWIQLIRRREPTAKIIVVATHGGPNQRQPDIDRQELWELFGKETVVDFFFVDSKPDAQGNRRGIEELQLAIARVAATRPEVGRSVPKSFAEVRHALQEKNVPYLSLDEVLAVCHAHKMDEEIAYLFIAISHRLGHLTHYETNPTCVTS